MMFMMSLQITAYFHRTPNATMRKYLMGLGALHREKGVEPEDFSERVDVAAEGPAQINDYVKLGYIRIRIK